MGPTTSSHQQGSTDRRNLDSLQVEVALVHQFIRKCFTLESARPLLDALQSAGTSIGASSSEIRTGVERIRSAMEAVDGRLELAPTPFEHVDRAARGEKRGRRPMNQDRLEASLDRFVLRYDQPAGAGRASWEILGHSVGPEVFRDLNGVVRLAIYGLLAQFAAQIPGEQ